MGSRHRRYRWLLAFSLVGLVGSGVGCGAGTARAKGTAAPDAAKERERGREPEPEREREAEGEGELPQLPPPGEETPPPSLLPTSVSGGFPAARYAQLDRTTCENELGKRKIGFDRVGEARGVIEPLRLKGPIAGIEFHSMLPAAQRKTSPYEIYDCRLVLALDDWARVLARHDVVEVVHYSVYRPPPGKAPLAGAGKRHGAGLAIDAAIFKTRDGKTMSVEKDFHGHIGQKPCGGGAASLKGLPSETVMLREIVCEAADQQLFNVLLTPDFNWPHRNHFHLEVSPTARWVYLR